MMQFYEHFGNWHYRLELVWICFVLFLESLCFSEGHEDDLTVWKVWMVSAAVFHRLES